MGVRRKGRELAMQALYQSDVRGEPALTALQLFFEHAEGASPRLWSTACANSASASIS